MLQFLRTGTIDELPNDPSVLVTTNGRTEQLRIPVRRITQQEQDAVDEKARQKAVDDLVQSWRDRLQLITVLTTFFASTESGLLSTATPRPTDTVTQVLLTANAGLVGALIVHIFAAMLSFIAAFILVRYKIQEAYSEEEEIMAESKMAASPVADSPDVERSASVKSLQRPAVVRSSNPRLVPVARFHKKLPLALLGRFYMLCILLTAAGFVLALIGTMCLTWYRQPRAASVFATACIGFCLVSSIGILV